MLSYGSVRLQITNRKKEILTTFGPKKTLGSVDGLPRNDEVAFRWPMLYYHISNRIN